MIYTRTHQEFGAWSIPGRKPVIVYATAVLARLAEIAAKAGASPIGGVFFGTSDDQEIRITHYRPIDCVPNEVGPEASAFDAAGEAGLGQLIDSYSSDPELAGLQPLGWYRSSGRSKIHLNMEDLLVWNRFFPLPTQVSLVLRVQENAPVRAGFFFRPQHGGPVRIDSSYRTFEIAPGAEATTDVSRLAEAVKSGGARGADDEHQDLSPASGIEMPLPPPELFTPPEAAPNRSIFVWAAMVCGAAFLTFLLALVWRTSGATPPTPFKELALRFKGSPDQLKLVWNPKSSIIREATSAQLRLIDAESVTDEMISGSTLAAGFHPVANRSGLVEAVLRIQPRDVGVRGLMAVAQFVGPSASDVQTSSAGVSTLRNEQVKLQNSLAARFQASRFYEERIKWLKSALSALSTSGKVPLAAQPSSVLAPSGSVPAPPQMAAPQTAKLGPPAEVVQVPPSPSPIPVDQGPAFGTDRPAARVTVPAADTPVNPTYAGPASGKFIWTGFLPPGGTVTIDGRRASSGSVNGSLPGVPVRIAVYPGEFSTSGLSVYSASPRHQAGAVTESRSAQNGWMNTRYVYDPGRARDAQISSNPSEAGGFKQIQIRSGDRAVSVVVVEWAVAR